MYIHQYIQWQGDSLSRNGSLLYRATAAAPQEVPVSIYQQAGIAYPKFFKMDLLSRVAFLASELVIPPIVSEQKEQVAVVLSSTSGCLDVDLKFEESRQSLASPGLFVYTLPNIMLGEICIRNGFKGEQMCTLSELPDPDWFAFYVADLLQRRGTEACLCGYAEATDAGIACVMLWVSKEPSPLPFNRSNLNAIFNTKRLTYHVNSIYSRQRHHYQHRQ